MKEWEIWTGDIHGMHPLVLLSRQPRIDSKLEVVVLKCVTMRGEAQRVPRIYETILDEADGLDWKTLCRCDLLFTVSKSSLTNRRGIVSPARRRDIGAKIVQGLAIGGL
jgi:hypothetical protein